MFFHSANSHSKSDKYACRDISNVGFSNSKSEYDDLVTIFDNVFQDAERPDISRSKMKMNENLSFRLIRKSGVQDVMVQFRFDRYVLSSHHFFLIFFLFRPLTLL